MLQLALLAATSPQRRALSTQLVRGLPLHSTTEIRKITVTRQALITQNMQIALITNSSRYVSHAENTTPHPVSASRAWLTQGASTKRSVVPSSATANSIT